MPSLTSAAPIWPEIGDRMVVKSRLISRLRSMGAGFRNASLGVLCFGKSGVVGLLADGFVVTQLCVAFERGIGQCQRGFGALERCPERSGLPASKGSLKIWKSGWFWVTFAP